MQRLACLISGAKIYLLISTPKQRISSMHDFVRPETEIRIAAYLFEDDGAIPNHPLLPLLLYGGVLALPKRDPAGACEAIFARTGWGSSWRNGIYSFHHYHSTAHEVLAIARGHARVCFGGEQGEIVEVQPGDVVLIPAGVGHKNLGASSDLLVVGAYPPGQQWDLCRGEPGERPQVLHNIEAVPMPATDPIYGEPGPLHNHWRQ
jgi:uncharacterized protein YjlB